MGLEQASYLSQIVASIAVVVSLVYVGLQLHQNTAQLQRAEANATFSQSSTLRLTIAGDADVAQLWLRGLQYDATLDAAGRLRFEFLLAERTWITFHMWDRTGRGLNVLGQWDRGSLPTLVRILSTPGGQAWWTQSKAAYPPAFTIAVDKGLAAASQGA